MMEEQDNLSEIKNSVMAPDAKIYRFTTITNSKISSNCIIGDFSRVTASEMHKHTRLDRFSLLHHSILGTCSYTGPYAMIFHSEIGKFCSIAWGVTIGPANHDYRRVSQHDFLYNDHYGIKPENKELPYDRFSSPCKIGHDVWIGAGSTILRGIEVGHGAVIGANSVVTKNIPPYAIVAGSPAKIIGYRFEKEEIAELLEARWWDLSLECIKNNYNSFINTDIKSAISTIKELK